MGETKFNISPRLSSSNGAMTIPGRNGSRLHNGSGIPSNSLGAVYDYYINTATGDLLEKTAIDTWTFRMNLVSVLSGPNFYLNDSLLSGDRSVDGDGHGLAFNNLSSFSVQAVISLMLADILVLGNPGGQVFIGPFQFPDADGTNGQVLMTNGSGQLLLQTIKNWHSDAWGNVVPYAGYGNPGDWEVDNDTKKVYEKTGPATWTLRGRLATAWGEITGTLTDQADLVAYINNRLAGLNWKSPSAKAATTTNIVLSGAQTIDGVSIIAGDRVLVKNQTSASQNGIYTASAGAWSRSADCDSTDELQTAVISVGEGTVNQNTTWIQITDNVSLGSSNILWQQLGASVPDATNVVKGILKLYQDLSAANTDGAPTQGSVKNAIDTEASARTGADVSVLATAQAYTDSSVSPLLKYRGLYDPTVTSVYPQTGGSGPSGAIRQGDVFKLSLSGIINGIPVLVGGFVIALIDNAGVVNNGNWAITQGNLGFVPENPANKSIAHGYVGLSGINGVEIIIPNGTGILQSIINNANTGVRTYTLPNKSGTFALMDDVLGAVWGNITGTITSQTDLVNYINDRLAGLTWKQSVRLATTADITLSGIQSIDGFSGVADMRILVKNQNTLSQNGVYLMKSGSWIRTTDADSGSELENAVVTVELGNANQNTTWIQTNNNITVGSSSLYFEKFTLQVYHADANNYGTAKLYANLTAANTDGSVDQATVFALKSYLEGLIALCPSIASSREVNTGVKNNKYVSPRMLRRSYVSPASNLYNFNNL